MQRLVNVPDQVAEPGECDGLFVIRAVLQLVHVLANGPNSVVLAGRGLVLIFAWLMPGKQTG